MKESCDQHAAHKPSPVTGSRHETQRVGKAMSSAARAVVLQAPRHLDHDLDHASPNLPLSADPLTREGVVPAPVPILQG